MITNPNIEPKLCKLGSEELLENLDNKYVAQEKFDGHRAIMLVKDGKNYFFSRRTSDVTGEKEDNTDRLSVMHNTPLFPIKFGECIFDGELVMADGNSDSSKVQQILGSTPERALEMWNSGHKLVYKIFDVLELDGEDTTKLPLKERLERLDSTRDVFREQEFFDLVPTYAMYKTYELIPLVTVRPVLLTYKKLLQEMLAQNREGIILKDFNSTYDFKRNSDWLKYKAIKTADLVIMGYVNPKKDYTGKFSKEELLEKKWQYWENGEPVSKTYAMGWVAGIVCGAYKDGKLKRVAVVKGFDDETQRYLKSNDRPTGITVEIAFQGIIDNDKKSLRHPRFVRFRPEKNAKDCLWENV